MTRPASIVSSPCRRICRFDPGKGLCEACGRSLAEIGAWSTMTEGERRAVMALLPERLRRSGEARPVPAEG